MRDEEEIITYVKLTYFPIVLTQDNLERIPKGAYIKLKEYWRNTMCSYEYDYNEIKETTWSKEAYVIARLFTNDYLDQNLVHRTLMLSLISYHRDNP